MRNILNIAKKELASVFASPAAFIFLGVFLSVSLFVFFWVEKFFARNIADVRPLFEWMPVLLIFLVAALTMRSWSEERRAGTIEMILSSPVPPAYFVLGKFLAALGLVAIALALTGPVPFTVSLLGPIDWGPVVGAYIATMFLAAAYVSIGLFVSARTDNQIVSLIVTSIICGLFYLIGSESLTGLFGTAAGEGLKLLGSGSRFESITRGVLDVRDIYYYVSIFGVFLTLNLFSLERLRWSEGRTPRHRTWRIVTGLVLANLLIGNVWLHQVPWARLDLTDGKIFSISDATRSYLAQLKEPLLIRGYFSAQTHPLLSPLVPKLRDLIKEYEVAGDGRVRVEFVDPLQYPELEEEANRRFNVKPVPFQTTNKYQASVTNSYFDVVVQYGDQFEKLGFRDLIEVKAQTESDLDVELRNPEYDITRAIKKVIYGYQAAGNLFSNIAKPVVFKGYISGDGKLPEALAPVRQSLDDVLAELAKESGGKLTVDIIDPDAGDGSVAEYINKDLGFRPLAMGLLDPRSFWFYMTLESDGRIEQVALPESFGKDNLKRSIEAGLKRFSSGFLKTVALHTPDPSAPMGRFGMAPSRKSFDLLREKLIENATVEAADLKNGAVPDNADILLAMSPKELDEKQLFAMDQFLMKGGTIVLSTSPYDVSMTGTMNATKHASGVGDWLKHHGINIDEALVLDPQNAPFPVPVNRNLGAYSVREIRMLDYPFFADIRGDGLNEGVEMTADLGQVTMSWASPISIDDEKNKDRKVMPLLESSEGSWTSYEPSIQPNFRKYGKVGFPESEETGPKMLAVAIEGQFSSYFAGKESPLLKKETADKEGEAKDDEKPVVSGVIERSPESGRIILFASNMFASDEVLDLAASANRSQYLNPVQLIENAVDWSLEDRGLLGIRSRGHFARTLVPMAPEQQALWEYANYALVALGLLVVFLIHRQTRRQAAVRYHRILAVGRA